MNVFKLNENKQYEIVKIIPTDEEIKATVPKRILEYFGGDENAESKIHRLGIADPTNADFLAYNSAVENFRLQADEEIATNAEYLKNTKQIEIGEGLTKQTILVAE